MIELSPNTACMIYLGVTIAFLLGLWVYKHLASKKRKISVIEKELFVCEYCQCAYLVELNKKVTRCTQCKSYNTR